jgi:hypothetical protein
MKFNIFLTSIPIILGSILCTITAIIINPEIFTSFFSTSPTKLFMDVEHYSNMVMYGYSHLVVHPSCNAFYPLWPWLIRTLVKPQTVDEAAFYFRIFSSLLSLVSIPLFLLLLKQNIKSYKIAFLTVALYAISPLSVFRMIGYTESIFSILSLILLILLTQLKRISKTSVKSIILLTSVFLLSLLLSLTRPFLFQAIFASIMALVSIIVIDRLQKNSTPIDLKFYSIVSFIICLGALIGYCIYGYSCIEFRGDFFAPFHDQKLWGKQLGFYPQVFLIPVKFADFTSIYLPIIALIISILICISTNIKKIIFIAPKLWQWILLFAYPPAFLAFYTLDLKKANFSKKSINSEDINLTQGAKNISSSYVFWFCMYFALIHCIGVFLTDPYIASIRRYIFGSPYFFLVIAYISQCFPTRKVSKLLLWVLGASGVLLIQYWIDYSKDRWIG